MLLQCYKSIYSVIIVFKVYRKLMMHNEQNNVTQMHPFQIDFIDFFN